MRWGCCKGSFGTGVIKIYKMGSSKLSGMTNPIFRGFKNIFLRHVAKGQDRTHIYSFFSPNMTNQPQQQKVIPSVSQFIQSNIKQTLCFLR